MCGKPASAHPPKKQLKKRARYDAKRSGRSSERRRIVVIDGEGYDAPDGRHLYTYFCGVDEGGKLVTEARNPKGLTTDECVDALLRIPRRTLRFGYGLSYDITKIIESLPPEDRYYLMRPETRRRFVCKTCRQRWSLRTITACPSCSSTQVRAYIPSMRLRGKRLDYLRGSFTVAREDRSTRVWDASKFFRKPLIDVLDDWAIGSAAERDVIRRMKARRDDFANVPGKDVEAYCQLECKLTAALMRKVLDAHTAAGLKLARYDGASATARSMLRRAKTDECKGDEPTGDLAAAIMRAYSAGRFEHRVVGRVEKPVHAFDISGAFPAGLVDQPCLKCGTWRRVRRGVKSAIARAALAVVRFTVMPRGPRDRAGMPWAPLPCRDEAGSLVFGTGFSGWAWAPEILAAMAGWPGLIEIHEAWVYKTRCKHRPFAFLRDAYAERARLGLDGAGRILKLGMTAVWGMTSQSVGSARYRSYVWAGSATAWVRAQILDVLAKHGADVLSIAADGILATRDLGLARKGLGGWTHDVAEGGAMLVRPGLFFRLDKTDARARGLGQNELLDAADDILRAWDTWDRRGAPPVVKVPVRRFGGAKQTILALSRCRCGESWPGVPEQGCPKCGRAGAWFRAGETAPGAYGTWRDVELPVEFDPYPKRERHWDRRGGSSPLRVRDLGGIESMPYVPGRPTPEAEKHMRDADD